MLTVIDDRYAATRGLLWSHMGWIFFKSTYEKMDLIDKTDLDNDRSEYPITPRALYCSDKLQL